MTVVVDSSALIAFLLGEEGAGDIEAVLDRETELRISSANWVETAMVLLGRGYESALEEARQLLLERNPFSLHHSLRRRSSCGILRA